MTVKEFMDKRTITNPPRKVRVISISSRGGDNDWTRYADCPIIKISTATKYIFLYVK